MLLLFMWPSLSPPTPRCFLHLHPSLALTSGPPAPLLQTFGLQLTSATRASFLIQATALLTPLLATLAGERLGAQVWAGCALALGGTLLIASDTAGGGAASGASAAAGFHLGQ